MAVLTEVLTEELQDLLHAENQLVKALPKMAKAAHDEDLKTAIQEHLDETKNQVERLKKVFELLESKAKAKPCKAMQGLIEEGEEVISEGKEKEEVAADLGLAGSARRVEHYEIAAYTCAIAMADQLGLEEVSQLLNETLEEEQAADEKLSELSEPLLSAAAGDMEEDDEEDDEELEEEEPAVTTPTRKR